MGDAMSQHLLVLNAPTSLEEVIVDWLLESECCQGFTSVAVRGHSSQHTGLTPGELVMGRQQRIQFQVHGSGQQLEGLLEQLRGSLPNADVHYWLLPVLQSGRLAG